MAVVILILRIYIFAVALVFAVYVLRHLIFSLNRIAGEQRIYYQDIVDSELPTISVLVPMHNEEIVARNILTALVCTVYPCEKLEIIPIMSVENGNNVHDVEIIPIDDHSTDETRSILMEFADKYKNVKPLYRTNARRGKSQSLNEAIEVAKGDIIVVFDADYVPPKGLVRDLAMCFKDPEVGAVMGRVVPTNTTKSLLTRLLDLERSSGYQVDQQARHNLKLIPQYGGTVGAFRKDIVTAFGRFDLNSLTEDTELTFRLFVRGWKVVYANRAECYEEVPEEWDVRARQIRRWSRGHNRVMFNYAIPILRSPYLSFWEKLDGFLLLSVYALPLIFILAMLASLTLFFLGEMQLFHGIFIFLLIIAFNAFGNFAPFYQIATASFLDGGTSRIRLLPFLMFSFFFNIWYVSQGFFYAVGDMMTKRETSWDKTRRYQKTEVKT
ncbi:MAG: glycosyltransferase family 2 protein [Candidatus Omnitrophica bacterium]|nr:glycosyltransferase family 2 protein [Candidatus Omnitrophota bacterium]